ncbi:hypothetical protein OD917_16335 [Flavobacterium sp. SH_e]|uniref:hypothetical protein n=1 Tax=Flavobacterium sp. SH_e TaxID=2983767 RepID=UPI0021E4F9AF|nr:hypothetical protein [Flavobacterium sp. SH_e]MCV2486503.1 hypothetical protein [Flavobacterium sp. SH_e]
MGTLILSFPPPRNWQDFEQLAKDVAKYRLAGDFENYGRQGQAQDGVDVYGWDKDEINSGLQCKHKGHTPATARKIVTAITTKIIDAELILADTFTPKLDRFIIATTTFRDVEIQTHINNLNDKRKGKGLPKIEIWFWEAFEEEINKHSELAYFYYDEILKKFNQYDKDIHILALLKHSLSRPAFNTNFHSENNCEDFLKAMSDTQRAFNTGKLYDRDGNLITTSYPAKNLSKQEDRNEITIIERLLQKIRSFTTDNLREGNIEQRDNFLYFPGDWQTKVSETLNNDRREIIDTLNNILKRHNIEKVETHIR